MVSNGFKQQIICIFSHRTSGFSVRVGEHNLYDDPGDEPYDATIPVSDIIIHEAYDGDNMDNDLALLRLAYPVTFSAHVQPVCLDGSPEPTGHQMCVATGWGTTIQGELPTPDVDYTLFHVGSVSNASVAFVRLNPLAAGHYYTRFFILY